ncbi:MAG: helix-turn-helix transcriptional regulator [Chthoniobacteraceae bacterium]|jgi:hypothetical protein
MSENKTEKKNDDIASLLAATPKVTDAVRARMREAARELDADPEFQAEYVKGLFVNTILEAMKEQNLTPSDVARKWGHSRQYLHKLLDEDKQVNFTIETMVELAMILGRRVEVHLLKKEETAHVVRRVKPQTVASLDTALSLAGPRRPAEYMTESFIQYLVGQGTFRGQIASTQATPSRVVHSTAPTHLLQYVSAGEPVAAIPRRLTDYMTEPFSALPLKPEYHYEERLSA